MWVVRTTSQVVPFRCEGVIGQIAEDPERRAFAWIGLRPRHRVSLENSLWVLNEAIQSCQGAAPANDYQKNQTSFVCRVFERIGGCCQKVLR